MRPLPLLLLTIAACTAPADRDTDTDTDIDTDTVDTDTDTDPAVDDDGDGHAAEEDCDDADADAFPGAYDRPNDGVDQDCDGSDRVFDGVVLDEGGAASTDVVFALPVPPSMDVALVVDTSAAATDHVRFAMNVGARATALGIADAHFGLATFEDYPYGTYGSAYETDLPFRLDLPLDPSAAAADASLTSALVRGGGDAPEATFEALYQALTGRGYDLDCDGVFDTGYDVPPFTPSAGDPFGGTASGGWGTTAGTLGGMGFRSGAVPVLVYITETEMRDADATTEVPGGCPADAGFDAVSGAAVAMDAWLIGGLSWGGSWTVADEQMEALAIATGATLDIDGDGVDDPLVIDMSDTSGSWTAVLDAALAAIAVETGADGRVETVSPTVDDPDGLVASFTPTSLTDVDARATPSVTVTLSLSGTVAATDEPQTTSVTVHLYVDGKLVGSETVQVEIPPAP